jgi:hypothetical protein
VGWIGFGPDRRVEAGDYCSFIAFLSHVYPAFGSGIAPSGRRYLDWIT